MATKYHRLDGGYVQSRTKSTRRTGPMPCNGLGEERYMDAENRVEAQV